MRFTGKVVLITGAANGIGRAAAVEFAKEGATLCATDIDGDGVARAMKETGAVTGSVETHQQDVTDPARWTALIKDIVARHGKLDVLVNNAGIGIFADIEQSNLDIWRKTMAVNLESVFLGTQAAIAVMKARGGVIVNVASIAGDVGEPLLAAYNASKGGVKLLTKNAALHCANVGYPIRVVGLHPGYCSTPLVANALAALPPEDGQRMAAEIQAKIPMRRLAEPREIARPLLFLASDDASYMTGSALVVDGGYSAA